MEEKPNIWKHSLNSGLIIGLILVAWSLFIYIAQIEQNQGLNILVSLAIWVGGIIWTHQQYKKQGDGSMTYGQGLGLGTLAIGVASVINGIFVFLYISFIDQSVMERAARAMEEQRVTMQDEGMSEAQVDQMIGFMEIFQNPGIILITGILGSIFFGFIISLIVSIFTKEENAVGITE